MWKLQSQRYSQRIVSSEWMLYSNLEKRGSSLGKLELVLIPIPKKSNAKKYSNYRTIAHISHVSKVMLIILQVRPKQYGNHELLDVQARFRKCRGTRAQIANIHWITEKAREFQKNIYFCFIDYAKAFDCVDHNKQWKILQEVGISTTLPTSWETCMQVKKQQLELDMEWWTGSK